MKLAIGTAQFGSKYGVANLLGQVSHQEVKNILKISEFNGIKILDTAVAYGSAEQTLGEIGIRSFDCVSKLPKIPNSSNPKSWVEDQIQQSINRLNVQHLYGMLLHHPEDLLMPKGFKYLEALLEAQDQGYIKNIGFSIYSPEILDKVTRVFWPDIVQAPYNILDQRLRSTGWLDRLVNKGTKIHARSVFLQGLLVMRPDIRPNYFKKWHKELAAWDRYVVEKNMGSMKCALDFVTAESRIDKIIVGVDSGRQLSELIDACDQKVHKVVFPESSDMDLIEPSRWSL